MRRRSVTRPEDKELISPTIGAGSLTRLVEGKQRVAEGIANALLVRAAQ